MTNTNIDQNDLQILFYLSNNGRISYKDLAQKLDITPPAVKYRIDRLIEKNIIQGFTTDIDLDVLTPNYHSFLLEMSIRPDKMKSTIEYLLSLQLFESVNVVTASRNIVATTYPLSSANVKKIYEMIARMESGPYSLTPIIDKMRINQMQRLDAERLTNIYCPECQELFTDKDGFIELIGNKVLGFCCVECRDKFINSKLDFMN